METAHQVAEKLLFINAVKLSPDKPFTWASGWKSPIYCDNRRILSFPYIRDYIKSELSNLIDQRFPDAEVIAGVATAGIAHGVLAADLLKLGFVYVRSGRKDHGLGNQIEGFFNSGQKIVVVEDLISTGGSSLQACEVLKAAGGDVKGVVAVFDYGFDHARKSFQQAGIAVYALSHYEALLEVALQKGMIQQEQLSVLQQWRQSPDTWGQG
ncbi:MAG: orotate phosphoribosyltransferase [Thermoflavifilum aggregans]|nr:orotate phosphoribosyltransferase [Thermoflavifilum aggregans]